MNPSTWRRLMFCVGMDDEFSTVCRARQRLAHGAICSL
ncbi:hypothetical protein C4K00_2979 [Pseudomonas synxantha]|nr:hypothetical protein C4K00_2979 [Pseudomonas synxantha]AZE78803.1 hypothetical protein C4J99_3019 [Pseudomonas synxantha]